MHVKKKKKPLPVKKVKIAKVVETEKSRPDGGWRKGKDDIKKRGLVTRFSIDTGHPMRDGLVNHSDLQSFLELNLNFKTPSVKVTLPNGADKRIPLFEEKDSTSKNPVFSVDKSKLIVQCDVPFSKNYVVMQIKKYLKANVKTVRCVPVTLSECGLVYAEH